MSQQSAAPAADVTLGEIVRSLQSLQEEIRALRGEHVRRDLYDAHRATMEANLARIDERDRQETAKLTERFEAQERDRITWRRQQNLTLAVAGISAAVAIAGLIIH